MKRILPALLLLLLAACAEGAPPSLNLPGVTPPLLPTAAEDTCGALSHSQLVNQDATALERELILGQVRVIRPGDAVTQDFRPDRINFQVNEAGLINRIYCG